MKVAVIMGGQGGEHAVSLRSGAAVMGALEALGHQAWPLTLTKEGGAVWPEGQGSLGQAFAALEAAKVDVAFIAMHGEQGEDGRLQALLELLQIPYQGSGVLASAMGLDKIRTKATFRQAGLPLAKEVVLVPGQPYDLEAIVADLGMPLVLKTPASGSSVGVSIVFEREHLDPQVSEMLASAPALLIEQFVKGREFTIPVLDDPKGRPEALPIIEIRPVSAAFFDYEAKYTPGATEEICPAPIPESLSQTLQALGLRAHIAMGCQGYSRTDCLVTAQGEIVLLEINTLPGLTAQSLLPQAAQAHGLTFPELIERLLRGALAKAKAR